MADNFVRKPVVFNKKSLWHMQILNRIEKESNNFSGYVMSILKVHFDIKPELEEVPDQREKANKNEQPDRTTRIVVNGKIL